MRSVATILVATTLVLHALLGCCSHHAHVGPASPDAQATVGHDCFAHGIADHEGTHHEGTDHERNLHDSPHVARQHVAQRGDESCHSTHQDAAQTPGHSSHHCQEGVCSFVVPGKWADGTAKHLFAGEFVANNPSQTPSSVVVSRAARAPVERCAAPPVPLYLRLQVLLT
ncbi:MAG: hypothetical protein U0935_16300 [Pirellulales bacterium]